MSSDEETSQQIREKFTAERSNNLQPVSQETPDDDFFFGPALPPHLLGKKNEESKKEEKIYGPLLPSSMSEKKENEIKKASFSEEKKRNIIGPEIPEHLRFDSAEKSEEIDISVCDSDFGPSLELMASGDTTSYYRNFEQKKAKVESPGESSSKRESWMLELPEEKAVNLGLCARQFRKRIPTEKERDRSVWTETPGGKEKKESHKKNKDFDQELKKKMLEERDKEMEKLAKKAAKKLRKKESLLEIHLKNLKKKKKKEAKKAEKKGELVQERRPFDRNIDLQVHRFDESQKRAILNKSRFLNDRFAAGESKFL